jgi:hypothetical protein
MRTARSRTSGENLFNLLFMAPSSQRLEPPQFPGRFTIALIVSPDNTRVKPVITRASLCGEVFLKIKSF